MLDKGKLIEEGTHQELLNMNGFYAKLVRGQIDSKDDKPEEEEEVEEPNDFLSGIDKKQID